MKNIFFISVFLFLACYQSGAQGWEWRQQVSGPDNDLCSAITTDLIGNTYVAGIFSNNITIASTTLSSPNIQAAFIAKFDGAGNLLWAVKAATDSSAINVSSITLSNNGSIAISGNFTNTAHFGIAASDSLSSLGDFDAFLAVYNASGNFMWANSLGDVGVDYSGGISADSSGNFYMTGEFHITPFPFSSSKLFVAKYDFSGNMQWLATEHTFGFSHFANGITTDPAGNTFIAGSFFNSIDFDSSAVLYSGNVESNAFIIKFDSNGNFIWGQKAGAASGYAGAKAVTLDEAGNAYICGLFHGTISFNSASLTGLFGTGSECFIAKCNPSGTFTWANKPIGLSSGEHIAYSSGQCFIEGYFTDSLTIPAYTIYNSGPDDRFIMQADTSGNLSALLQFGDNASFTSSAFALASSSIFVCGGFTGTLPLNPLPPLMATSTNSDGFIAKHDGLLAIHETSGHPAFIMYPNPASYELRIQNSELKIENIEIYDVLGQRVFAQQPTASDWQLNIDVSFFPPGVYFIHLKNEDGIISQKLIISR